jgi:transposase-like protein
MPAAIEPIIKQRVIAQYLQGDSRDGIAADNGIGTGTVSNILDEWKKGLQDSDYESVRELANRRKKEGVTLGDVKFALRIKNYIKQIDPDEERVEQFIARCANSQDPQKLVDVLDKIGHIDVPLEELEEHIKLKQAEKEKLLHEIDEARAIVNSVNVDRKTIEDFNELKIEMGKYHLEEPKKFLNLLRNLKYKYDDKRILAAFSTIRSMKKVKWEIDNDRRGFEDRIKKCKDVLPLAEQIMRFNVGIGELLAFHSAVYEKVDMERIPPDTAAYKVVEDIRDYSQLGGLKKEINRLQQQIFMYNAFMANKQAALMSLMRLQCMGINEDRILNMEHFLQQYDRQQRVRQPTA